MKLENAIKSRYLLDDNDQPILNLNDYTDLRILYTENHNKGRLNINGTIHYVPTLLTSLNPSKVLRGVVKSETPINTYDTIAKATKSPSLEVHDYFSYCSTIDQISAALSEEKIVALVADNETINVLGSRYFIESPEYPKSLGEESLKTMTFISYDFLFNLQYTLYQKYAYRETKKVLDHELELLNMSTMSETKEG